MRIAISDLIHLSDLLPSDEAACVKHLDEREIYDRTLRIPFPYHASDFHHGLKMVEDTNVRQGRIVQWAIRNSEKDLIGAIGFEGFQLGISHRAEIGYWLAKPFWGRGIMTDVVRILCQYAFEEFQLAKITAQVFPNNRASGRVLEKCGFLEEGYLRRQFLKNGEFMDVRFFGLLKS